MGTHCYIGIEDKNDGTVRYVYIHYDGYFSYIVPMLRKYYMERKNVESLIDCGNTQSLFLPNQWIVAESEGCLPLTVSDRYVFEREAMIVHYFYLFNREDEWECKSTEMFRMSELK